ncbi:hypothetical protein ACH79_07415 [Bradyrhizobium sp. CCBAU 051011]|nr:hypothetical protein ACH79_07415 [Bradyrhizobium sp. CCBAU 051011]
MTLSKVMWVIAIFPMVRYPVLALCIWRTNDRRGCRQLTWLSLAMGFRGRHRRATWNTSASEGAKQMQQARTSQRVARMRAR